MRHEFGFLVFGVGDSQYRKMAENVSETLREKGCDVHLVVDVDHGLVSDVLGDNILVTNGWVNWYRLFSDLLSPFDRTMVVDADIHIGCGFDSWLENYEFSAPSILDGSRIFSLGWSPEQFVGKSNVPLRWATIFTIDRGEHSLRFMDTCRDIFRYLDVYRKVFGIHGPLRVDHIMSLAAMQVPLGSIDIPPVPFMIGELEDVPLGDGGMDDHSIAHLVVSRRRYV